jgi:hypothetical protein
LVAIAAVGVALSLFATLSEFALPNARLVQVVRTAFAYNDLAYATKIREDFFTECALLSMQKLRQGGRFWSALETRFILRVDEHPCDTLRALVLAQADAPSLLPGAGTIIRLAAGILKLSCLV